MNLSRRNFLRAGISLPLITNALKSSPGLVREKFIAVKPSSVDLSRLLHCISLVESGGDDSAVGPKGERSKYQIGFDVWRQHAEFKPTEQNFVRFCNGEDAEHVARVHIRWLYTELNDRRMILRQPFWLAFAWHAGFERTLLELRGASITPDLYRYAARVDNLYADPTLIYVPGA
jgi:hypothetical protein